MAGELQSISVITLGIDDLERSKRFYADGFGWTPVFDNGEIAFYQMNGLVLGTWSREALAADMNAPAPVPPGGFALALAHNVPTEADVDPLIDRLIMAGGTLLRAADNPPHGGRRGYIADPDGHVWEIAYNPAWPIDAEGHVRFAE